MNIYRIHDGLGRRHLHQHQQQEEQQLKIDNWQH